MTTLKKWKDDLRRHGVSTERIAETLKAGKGVLSDANLVRVQDMLDASQWLYSEGNRTAALWAGQAAWEAAALIHYSVEDHPLHRTKWATQAGGAKGNANKGSPKRAAILRSLKSYPPDDRNAAAKIAKNIGCRPEYVRKVRAEISRTALP